MLINLIGNQISDNLHIAYVDDTDLVLYHCGNSKCDTDVVNLYSRSHLSQPSEAALQRLHHITTALCIQDRTSTNNGK